jgi:hypothetical protein
VPRVDHTVLAAGDRRGQFCVQGALAVVDLAQDVFGPQVGLTGSSRSFICASMSSTCRGARVTISSWKGSSSSRPATSPGKRCA